MEPGTLRIIAKESYQQTKADEAALREKENELARKQLEAALSKLFNAPVTAQLTNQSHQNFPIVEADDLRFTFTADGDMGKQLVLLDVCPKCAVECASEPINHLPQLGALMAQFEPDSDHNC